MGSQEGYYSIHKIKKNSRVDDKEAEIRHPNEMLLNLSQVLKLEPSG